MAETPEQKRERLDNYFLHPERLIYDMVGGSGYALEIWREVVYHYTKKNPELNSIYPDGILMIKQKLENHGLCTADDARRFHKWVTNYQTNNHLLNCTSPSATLHQYL